jgi:hypothetical protein
VILAERTGPTWSLIGLTDAALDGPTIIAIWSRILTSLALVIG